jgi:hypothetical protein
MFTVSEYELTLTNSELERIPDSLVAFFQKFDDVLVLKVLRAGERSKY